MRRRGPIVERLARSAGFSLAGGTALTAFMHWSQSHWWVGPVVGGTLAVVLFALWGW